MPLHPGKSRQVFSQNVREMMHAGHPQAQALAAAYREQRQSRPMGGPVWPLPGLAGAAGGPQMGLGALAGKVAPGMAAGLPMGMPGMGGQMPGLGNLRRPGFQEGGAPDDSDIPPLHREALARRGIETASSDLSDIATPEQLKAMGAYAADPFGLPSYAASKVAPEFGEKWRGLEAEHPEAALPGGLLSAAGPEALIGRGIGAAATAARTFPKTAMGLGAAGALAAGTAEAGDQPTGRPAFTDEDQARLAQLDKSVGDLAKEKEGKLSASAKKGEPKSVRDGISSTYDARIAAASKESTDMRANMQARQQDYDKKGQPLAIRDPELVDEIRKGAIGYAGAHGAVRGLLGGSPWRAAATAVGGAGEAVLGAFAPTMLDLFQPPDTQAYRQAHDNLQSPEFWKTVIAPDVLYGGAAAAGGHGAGYTAHEVASRVGEGIASAARGIKRLFGGESSAGPGGISAAAEPAAAPKPWPTNPDGTRKWPTDPKELGQLKQSDKDGRWRDRFGHVVPQNLEPPGQAQGGAVQGFQFGGAPWYERSEARGLGHTGPVIGSSLGRGDSKSLSVPGGSYVLPAKFVSGLGQGNTMAGHNILNSMFHGAPYGASGGPYGTSMPKMGGRGMGAPKPPKIGGMGGFRAGGTPDGTGRSVPIKISDGEHVLSPEQVADVDRHFGGSGDIDRGHRILDAWVMHEHNRLIKELKKLPPPAESDVNPKKAA